MRRWILIAICVGVVAGLIVDAVDNTIRSTRSNAAANSASASGQSPGSTPSSATVPNLIRTRLNVAELELKNLGLRYRQLGGGLLGIIVKSDWVVCQSQPSAGTVTPPDTQIALVVGRPWDC